MSNVDIITFGCRLNAFESEVMRAKALDADLSDAVIVNTCAVTAEAVRQARQTIRKIRRERPAARIIVTGCAAQIDGQSFAEMAEVDRVLGNQEKLTKAAFAFDPDDHERVKVNDIMTARAIAPHLIGGFDGRARAFVQIQNGCDHRCTFCVIPFGRGPSRSVPVGEVVAQVRTLVTSGYREIVLTGVDITSYGSDLPGTPRLGDLARRILKLVPDLPRLRLSSIDAIEVDPGLIELIARESRLMPHFHLSLQSGDDLILKRMKRRHSMADARAFVDQLRSARADAVFGADVIVGFPTEDEAMFENSRAMIGDLGLTFLHVFPYSPRPGTPAARMPQVPKPVIKARAEQLRADGARALAAYLRGEVGRRQSALIESAHIGRAEGFATIKFARPQSIGAIVPVIADDCTERELIAA